MKKILTNVLLLVAVLVSATGQLRAQSCCAKGGDWQLLALNTDFREAHLAPLPLEYSPAKGAMINFNTTDAGKDGGAFYVPSDQPTDKVLVIFHEWWGLNDYIKREAERWQGLLGNVDVYAVDLYDGRVANDPETAGKLMSSLDQKRGETIVKGLLKKIGNDKLVATLGWCMGGTWSFTGTLLAGNNAAGCVAYYGFPEKNEKKIKTLQADVLYIRAKQDGFITAADAAEFMKQVIAVKPKSKMLEYDAVHAFANPSNPKYDMKSAKLAEAEAVKFLKERLQQE